MSSDGPKTSLGELCYKFTRLKQLASSPCTCTEEQLSGVDTSVCPSCAAARDVNEIAQSIRLAYDAFSEDLKKIIWGGNESKERI